MPRGYPDYQSSREPAIALQTVWEDEFESPALKWIPASNFGGTNPVLSTTQAWKGVQSVYFVTVAAGATWAQIERRFPLFKIGRVGIEFFTYLNSRTPGYLLASARIYDGSNISEALLRLDSQAKTATIITPVGPIVVATLSFNPAATRSWIPVKIVADMNTDRYTRLLIGPQEIDLSTHLLVPGVASTDKLLRVRFDLIGDAAGAMTAYVDNFILTQNEP